MRRILVVDDEFPIREWLTHVIRNNRPQYEVCSAQNGLDALEQMQMQLFDLIISDIRMPQLDGIGLFEQVNRLHPGTGIIVLSSYDDYLYVRSAFKHAAVDYLLKAEISESGFLATLDNFLTNGMEMMSVYGRAKHYVRLSSLQPILGRIWLVLQQVACRCPAAATFYSCFEQPNLIFPATGR